MWKPRLIRHVKGCKSKGCKRESVAIPCIPLYIAKYRHLFSSSDEEDHPLKVKESPPSSPFTLPSFSLAHPDMVLIIQTEFCVMSTFDTFA